MSSAAMETLNRGRPGQVHSVFDRTFNVIFDERLVGVSRQDVSENPMNVLIEVPTNETMQALGVRKGLPVWVDGRKFEVGEVLEVSLEGAAVWKPLANASNPLLLDAVRRNLDVAEKVAASRDVREGLGPLLKKIGAIFGGGRIEVDGLNDISRKALPHLQQLIEGVRRSDAGMVKEAVGKLIGLGPGLTPSADDFLSGLIGALVWFSNTFSKNIDCVGVLKEEILAQGGKTNLLSRQLLEHAARGENNARVEKLLISIFAGADSEIKPQLERVMEIGETSGIDMTVGILVAIRIGMDSVGRSEKL